MNKFKSKIFKIITLSSLLILLIFSLLIYYKFNIVKKIETKSEIIYCGNKTLSRDESSGKSIFNSNCAACHKIDAHSTPDFIENVFERIPNEKYFEMFINNEDSLIRAKNKYVMNLRNDLPKDYGFTHNFNFSKEEIEFLKKYIK